jgi:hypothetical protein
MAELSVLLSLAGYGLGTLGAALVFIEFFMTPSYLEYQPEWDGWNLTVNPIEADEYSWAGRIGALLMALAFALLFLATLLGQAG